MNPLPPTSSPHRPSLSFVRKLAFSVTTCCALLAFVELSWRVVNGWNRHWIDPHRYHPVLGWCLREGWAGRGNWVGGYSRVNPQGIRADCPSLPKPPGEKRLLALGDSVTFGAFVPTQDTWPTQVDQLLQASGQGWRVLNAGTTGYDPAQEVDWLDLFGWRLQPDALAIAFCRNDIGPSQRAPSLAHRPTGAALRWLTEHSILAHKLQHGLWHLENRFGLASATLPTPPEAKPDEVLSGWALVEQSYRRLARLARERNLPVVLVVFPTLDLLEGRAADDFSKRLQTLGKELDWTVIDVGDAVGPDAARLFVPGDPIHPNAEGYRRAAEKIAAVLRAGSVLR